MSKGQGRLRRFHQGDTLIEQGEQEAIAYIIHTGWVRVHHQHKDTTLPLVTLGPGEIVGELGLMGLAATRTASVIAVTDVELEVIDRTAMIRLANGSASDIVPLLAALFSRLQALQQRQEKEVTAQDQKRVYATIRPENPLAQQALCTQEVTVTHLPWVFGAYRPPASVTDLFQPSLPADTLLPTPDPAIAHDHLTLQQRADGELELRLAHAGDFLRINDEPLPKLPATRHAPLPAGETRITFGSPAEPYSFIITTPAAT